MPTPPWVRDEEAAEAAEEERRTLLQEGEVKARKVFSGFVDFAFSGNILEIAFGLMLVYQEVLQPRVRFH